MKVLFLSDGRGQDYMRDCVFHGLRCLLGPALVDAKRLDSMYIGADRSQMYGKGFTLYAELPDIEVDRTDIPSKIKNKYFDLVVYGSIHRCHDYLHEVSSMYPPERVVFIDGEDHPGYLKGLGGVYFKRELHSPQPAVWPIQFAIPKNKILDGPLHKSRIMAPMDPMDASTYIYKDEKSYYAQYADSMYAATMMKAGWDCLRHYEILSQWCLPYFRCFEQCPPSIMENLPRPEMNLVKTVVEYFHPPFLRSSESILKSLWQDVMPSMIAVTQARLTTEALASYVLSTVGVERKDMVCT